MQNSSLILLLMYVVRQIIEGMVCAKKSIRSHLPAFAGWFAHPGLDISEFLQFLAVNLVVFVEVVVEGVEFHLHLLLHFDELQQVIFAFLGGAFGGRDGSVDAFVRLGAVDLQLFLLDLLEGELLEGGELVEFGEIFLVGVAAVAKTEEVAVAGLTCFHCLSAPITINDYNRIGIPPPPSPSALLSARSFNIMCECNPCECWWCNCGVWNGCALLYGCGGFWCCKPFPMLNFSSQCCYCFETTGIGCNALCCGYDCCIPQWLNFYTSSQYSERRHHHYPQVY